jgi:hypothetical protein
MTTVSESQVISQRNTFKQWALEMFVFYQVKISAQRFVILNTLSIALPLQYLLVK